MDIAEPVNRLVEQFKKLPGIGTKSAQRLAFFILKMDQARRCFEGFNPELSRK